ncbi:double-strand break repair helicase AddA [Paramagnetospirillum magneticum]|uniref:DNA 3'-5' helicase n=1 Tax=Paramagnetospirillum magneticum (strain ATCC 700264 / AMB-1) TaxID=342108 RepID=Q2VZK9_PARM1|nr:double-strand break repair helicase AddA [Paramagnetospirillum magneticum]BAE52966.1 ATP-dependent exoDNAse beta subunit [Paramagnetospirillum magneticum AMB-1]
MTDGSVLSFDADQRQRRAADPTASVWVAASAGTGKTKVLTDRVLTLLLAGTPPHKILCLTFTKAAAAEMSNRIAGRLGQWATAHDSDLADDLGRLLGRAPSPGEMTGARRLFAALLDAPGGMHMETIHAFCQSLLRRFPLEAGIAPHFQVMDDRDAGELLEAAKLEILSQARMGDGALGGALALVTSRVHETAFPELMGELTAERGRLERLFERHGGVEGALAALRTRLGLEAGDTPDSLLAWATDEAHFQGEGLREAVAALLTGSDSDRKRGEAMARWLADPAGRENGFAGWCAQFLTAEGGIRKTLATKAVREGFPGVEDCLLAEAERLYRLTERLRAARIAEATGALLTLGGALLASYRRAKTHRALMDYDDLILGARDLLARPGVAPWVLYKLDGGIDHVLIDEAQDTNPDQWAVVEKLTEEFFAGRGARETLRTVFAVGDAKQSIYSFQRADPREFERMREAFATHVPAAGGKWEVVDLNLSFRSAPAVLEAVNAVFAPGRPGRDGVAGDEDITHLPHRGGQAGRVEVWPVVEPRPADELPAWKPPVERIRGDSPRTRLARLMAARIRAMIDGEVLESKGRPVRAGDVLVLVRRRGGFVEDLVRELKSRKVEVAGADRMVLTEQMAVMDLMALGNFLLLPEDDLTLATVLKGPLVGLGEDQLFTLAHHRGKDVGLWEALRQGVADEGGVFEAAFRRLSELLAQADRVSPHTLYARVLGPLGGRRRLLARLGLEAEDSIDEFMSLTLAFERAHPPSLQGFLHWLEAGALEIKRDLEQAGRDAVRIMTVHGSKGLQAPIVFLPDTMQVPTRSPRLLWLGEGEGELPAWPPRAEDMDSVCRQGADARKQSREREYRRLLYVAMTRAEDRLVVCGWRGLKAAPETCWHALVQCALAPTAAAFDDPFLAKAAETAEGPVLVLANAQTAPPEKEKGAGPGAGQSSPLPDWALLSAEPEPIPPRPLAPSRPEGEEPTVRSPLAEMDGKPRWQRGKLIHRLLQTVPDLPPPDRSRAMLRFLARPAWGLETPEQLAIANEVSDILDHPGLAGLFAPGSRAEVPLVGRIGDRVVSGRVDRLAVSDTEVVIADYKTNRRPPATPDEVPELYVRQMAAYRLALACIYPSHRVRCVLVWTDGPLLTEIPSARLDDALAGLVE